MKRVMARAAAHEEQGGEQRARDAALGLLARSIRFRHTRLALLRFADAVAIGAQPDPDQWKYCFETALASKDPALQAVFQRAAVTAFGNN